jgi:hypothetical protein
MAAAHAAGSAIEAVASAEATIATTVIAMLRRSAGWHAKGKQRCQGRAKRKPGGAARG